MEVETFRANLNELFEHFLFGNVAENDMLRVDWQNGETIGDTARFLLFLFFQTSFKVLERLRVGKLLVADHISNQSIARDYVPFDDLSETLEVVIVADDQSATDGRSLLLVSLNDIDMHVVVFPELPGERDAILTTGRWPEEEIARLQLIQLRDGSS